MEDLQGYRIYRFSCSKWAQNMLTSPTVSLAAHVNWEHTMYYLGRRYMTIIECFFRTGIGTKIGKRSPSHAHKTMRSFLSYQNEGNYQKFPTSWFRRPKHLKFKEIQKHIIQLGFPFRSGMGIIPSRNIPDGRCGRRRRRGRRSPRCRRTVRRTAPWRRPTGAVIDLGFWHSVFRTVFSCLIKYL